MTALQIFPQVETCESDPFYFLAFHSYDATQAAAGLVRYWKQCHEVFGDRAYRPLTIAIDDDNDNDHGTSGGNVSALTGKDIHLF